MTATRLLGQKFWGRPARASNATLGIWINPENRSEVLEFVQKRIRRLNGVTDVYTVPMFPQGNTFLKRAKAATTEH